jgi:hypothetical protein
LGRSLQTSEAGVSGPGKGRNSWNQNDHNLSIRTPFLMILGLLESQQRALQLYAEKHHSTTKEDKTKWWKVWPLFKDKSVKPPNTKNTIRVSCKIRFWWARACHGNNHKL